ncbi:hypothetical protein V7O66_01010 [Methanolobus sp. ZRKC3]|uniref:hypothetical protein n=1 Tax=Methanolobus sp. ZRKC3 TaxID=3125786 RepID=UPI00324E5D2E
MSLPLEKLYNMPIALLMLVGLSLSVFLFYSLMKAAESGNVLMVIILAIAISIVSIIISKAVKYHSFKKL